MYEQKPGKLDLVMVAGDDFSLPITISVYLYALLIRRTA